MSTLLIRVPESAGTLYERIQYPAGELQVRLLPCTVKQLFESSSVQVLCRRAHEHVMELALLSDALVGAVPHLESTLVLPYLPYARADRRFGEGDCHGLGTFAGLLDWGMHFNRVRTLDVHSYRAGKHVRGLENVSPLPFVKKVMAEIGDLLVVLLPDEGAKRYQIMGALECAKKRDPKTGKLTEFEVPWFHSKNALIVDDICDGGGTFIGLAGALKNVHRPPKLYLFVTHGIFSKGLKDLLKYFEKVYTTDSIYDPDRVGGGLYFPNEKLEVFSCESILLGGENETPLHLP